jgi:hypothetical protein
MYEAEKQTDREVRMLETEVSDASLDLDAFFAYCPELPHQEGSSSGSSAEPP